MYLCDCFLVSAFVALSRSFVGFCLSMADPNVSHPQSFPFLRESVNAFSAHGFPPVHLHQHFTRLSCSFPQFVAELACTLLHTAVTLPLTLTTFIWPQSVYTAGHKQCMLCVSILPMFLKNHAHARTHAPSCSSDMTPFNELFRHTLHNACALSHR